MIANYHTHTVRCRHAVGAEEEYVQHAIDSGLQILGFSDHTPYPFPGGYYSNFRMFPERLDDYVDTVERLKQKYAAQLEIHLGLEVEFYPKYFPELLQRVKETPVEYFLLGQHYVGNEIAEHYSGWPTEDESILEAYCNQTIDAMYTGLFTYFAHPDLIHFTGNEAVFEKHMRRVCKVARECQMPLEINLLGLREGRHYPKERFLWLAAEEGCKVVLGCDAHSPQTVCDQESEKKALEWIRAFGLELLQTVPLRSL